MISRYRTAELVWDLEPSLFNSTVNWLGYCPPAPGDSDWCDYLAVCNLAADLSTDSLKFFHAAAGAISPVAVTNEELENAKTCYAVWNRLALFFSQLSPELILSDTKVATQPNRYEVLVQSIKKLI